MGQLRETLSRLDIGGRSLSDRLRRQEQHRARLGAEALRRVGQANSACGSIAPAVAARRRRTFACFRCVMRGRLTLFSPRVASSSACLESRACCDSCMHRVRRWARAARSHRQRPIEQRRLDQARSLGLVPPAADAEPPAPSEPVSELLAGKELPQFQADGRMNAVLVRDVPERMPSLVKR